MTPFRQILVVCGFILLILPSLATAQTAPSIKLFSCTLNDGANALAVHLVEDQVIYKYSDDLENIELTLFDKIPNVRHTLGLWDGPNFTETVTFFNGDTAYEVFSEVIRLPLAPHLDVLGGRPVDGGVVITQPNGKRTEVLCDRGTIAPRNPLMRLVRLTQAKTPQYNLYQDCVASGILPHGCIELSLDQCAAIERERPYPLNCLSEHLTLALVTLEENYTAARAFAETEGLDVEALAFSQSVWERHKQVDCDITETLSQRKSNRFDSRYTCGINYTLDRIAFLQRYLNGLL
ncbi:hypothetical protein [Parasulfitobacter algicola]|uniref:Lysozyme inhibitor LprI N-terminal domain-containing protein n=1 Tax=Parasulfitobacter algicola TaxID=2614809 RepID=A0ABX2IN08_9RHOB|nr:hypothetical protein [Sulfitobacter algicola]NSX54259.1 hypothetical protein [Sulfitobacter algicola]